MDQFFVDASQIDGKEITIVGKDVNHLRNVLRKRIGDEISVSDGTSKEYRCRIREIEKEFVKCDLEFIKEADTELNVKVHLYQGLPKSDKLELIIQKCIELGVYEIIPVECKRSVVKIAKEKADKKTARFNAIAEAAAKQSKRRIIPNVLAPISFKEAIDRAKNDDVKLIPYELSEEGMEKTRGIFKNMKPDCDVSVFIGPEGGFDEAEVSMAIESGFDAITLGRRILRTETAGMTVMSWIVLEMD